MKISAGAIYSDDTFELMLEPEEYEAFLRASIVALQIPWELGSPRITDLEIQGMQIVTSRGTWKAVVKKVDNKDG